MLAVARSVLALLTLAAIGRQLALHVEGEHSVLNFFSYFTNLSNLFAAVVLLVSVFRPATRSRDVARYLSVVNMSIVGLVFAVLLRNVDLGALLPWVNFVLHTIMPVAVVVDWLIAPPRSAMNARVLRLALVFPALYLAYVIVRGAQTGWYPYPFLDPAHVGGYGGVAAYALGITLTFLIAAWALLWGGNRMAMYRQRSWIAPSHDPSIDA